MPVAARGPLAFRLAYQCSEVVGVDLSPRMIEHAKRRQSKLGIGNVSFHTGDVSRLDHFKDHAFAYATVVMAIHEMPREPRDAVLQELRQTGSESRQIR
ncbi:MAG: class I SAM-dependent methyltransferase [Rhodothermia bacterium]